jgi:hypothetical protein
VPARTRCGRSPMSEDLLRGGRQRAGRGGRRRCVRLPRAPAWRPNGDPPLRWTTVTELLRRLGQPPAVRPDRPRSTGEPLSIPLPTKRLLASTAGGIPVAHVVTHGPGRLPLVDARHRSPLLRPRRARPRSQRAQLPKHGGRPRSSPTATRPTPSTRRPSFGRCPIANSSIERSTDMARSVRTRGHRGATSERAS